MTEHSPQGNLHRETFCPFPFSARAYLGLRKGLFWCSNDQQLTLCQHKSHIISASNLLHYEVILRKKKIDSFVVLCATYYATHLLWQAGLVCRQSSLIPALWLQSHAVVAQAQCELALSCWNKNCCLDGSIFAFVTHAMGTSTSSYHHRDNVDGAFLNVTRRAQQPWLLQEV